MNLLTNILNTRIWPGLSSHHFNHQSPKPGQGNWGFTFYGETSSALKEPVKIFNREQPTDQIDQKRLSQESNEWKEDPLASFPLAIANPGDRLFILRLKGSAQTQRYLMTMGLYPGQEIQVLSLTDTPSSAIIAIGDRQLGFSATQANQIMVTPFNVMNLEPSKVNSSQANSADFHNQKPNKSKWPFASTENICLGDLAQGCKGRVMGYNQVTRGYKGKLLAMGLTPGTEFAITRYAPLGDPVEIRVRGFNLSLRKHEANALLVEEVCL